MKTRILHLSFVILLSGPCLLFAQSNKKKVSANWVLKNPFEQKVFIENNVGQFDGKAEKETGKILYSTRINGITVYFTSNEIIYCHNDIKVQRGGRWGDPDKKGNSVPDYMHPQYFSFEWTGSSADVQVIPKEKVSYYYTYPKHGGGSIIAHAFKKLLYQNVYPGIDIEYSFRQDETGLEYKVVVHPGADLSLVQEVYKDAEHITLDSKGSIEAESSFGKFTEQAPREIYYAEDNIQVKGSFVINGNSSGISVGDYDHSKTLVIDPFITDPSFYSYDAVYDIDYDWQGNIYGYGGSYPYQVIKLNNNGIIKWINGSISNYLGLGYYGDFCVDKASGKSYVAEGISLNKENIIEFDNNGVEIDTFAVKMWELWRMAYDACLGKIIIGGGGTVDRTTILDSSLTNDDTIDTLGSSINTYDICLMAIDDYSNSCYFAVAKTIFSPDTTFNNVLVKCPVPALSPPAFTVKDGYSFKEASIPYLPDSNGNGMNGMAVSPYWLYLYDGSTIKRFDKNTGVLTEKKVISSVSEDWGGLAVDACDNLYVGDSNSIELRDSTLTNKGHITAPGNIYDLQLVQGDILAGGMGFIASYPVAVPPVSISITKTTASSCYACDGSAIAVVKSCVADTSLYSYQWSNGETGNKATGLCIGNYAVTVSIGCETRFTDTVNIGALSTGGVSFNTTVKNEDCYGDSNGAIIITPTGGSPPYTYVWNPSAGTGYAIGNLSVGTYTVMVEDSGGCAAEIINVTQPGQVNIDRSYFLPVGCYGDSTGSLAVSVNGGTPAYSYLWQPTGNTTDSIGNLTSGYYTVTVTDANGCKSEDSIYLPQAAPINITMPSIEYVYKGQSVALVGSANNGTPPYTYVWDDGIHDSVIVVSPLDTTIYQLVVIDSNGCKIYKNVTVDVLPACDVFVPTAFSPNKDGQNDILYVRGSTCIGSLDFMIYDRWGNKVFETHNLDDGWDGNYLGQAMNTGTYVYYLSAITLYGKVITQSGSIALVR